MNSLVILVIEDEPEVRRSIVRDLSAFAGPIRIDQAESIEDAKAAMAEAKADGDVVGLVLADHRLPGRTGVDFLVELNASDETSGIRKVLITGQAGHTDTIRAINAANLDRYITKPWEITELETVVSDLLTDFVIQSGIPPLPYVATLDGPRLVEHFSHQEHYN